MLNKLETRNPVKYSDEARFQMLKKKLKHNTENYNIRKNLKKQNLEKIPIEEFYINSFMLVQFINE